MGLGRFLFKLCVKWLQIEVVPPSHLYSNFARLNFEVEAGDVVLVEGRTRVSQVIKTVTQSTWTHSAIYIGRLVDIDDLALRETIQAHYNGDPTEQLMIESLLGEGTIVAPLSKYEGEHLRICRPVGLSQSDQFNVIHYAASQLGVAYDVRQLLDLARFFFPYALLPRRWRSSLFEQKAGEATRHVCSSMMAEAYSHVDFPVLPFIERRPEGGMILYKRNPRLFTPKDFDYSPYFDVLKFPYLDRGDVAAYRLLPWSDSGMVYNDEQDFRHRLAEMAEEAKEIEVDEAKVEATEANVKEPADSPETPEPSQDHESSAEPEVDKTSDNIKASEDKVTDSEESTKRD